MPLAAAQLRAPLYEDKVVDFLFAKAEISERDVTRAEIEAAIEAEDDGGHVHGPGCGHDHADAKPAKKAAAKKPAAKKAEAEEVAEGEACCQEGCGEEGRAEGGLLPRNPSLLPRRRRLRSLRRSSKPSVSPNPSVLSLSKHRSFLSALEG